ncbi:NAD(P)-binding protein [Rhizodiscina lignyota]|uniref:NAD(P)-binding protein n=1 Tax=Rhizodiscina lignyota TaxID=1504668 RepID=A0A9P4M2N1_9PEZI|nr:NAD(P)-binding protein [Rhizodiscina lignyota]
MGATWSQFFPPTPTLTEANLPSQKGRVFIVTGGYSGIGLELARILYNAGGKVYIAGRSVSSGQDALRTIKSSNDTASAGELEFLHIDLSDLQAVNAAAEEFRAKESKLDVLFNNAAVSMPPPGNTTKQGHELQLGTNALGPYLFTQLLMPCLEKAVETAPKGSVRVVWTGSLVIDQTAPKGGFEMSKIDKPATNLPGQSDNYTLSKMANWFICSELARQSGAEGKGIMHIVQNPGNLYTNLLRHHSWLQWFVSPLLHKPIMGSYTELWAGLSEELTVEMNGCYVVPWGRVHPSPRRDLLEALKSKEDGGTGRAAEFVEWCFEQTKEFR